MRRVVVTGIGGVTPLAAGIRQTWRCLLKSECGVVSTASRGSQFASLPSRVAGLVPTGPREESRWQAKDWLLASDERQMALFAQYAIASASEALDDAGWHPTAQADLEATGVTIGSGIGNLDEAYNTSIAFHQSGYRKVSPLFVPRLLINLAAGHVSIKHGFKGPNHAATTACTTGLHAIGDASRLIAFGDADVMVAGGAESCIHPLAMAGFARARSLATDWNDDPTASSRPFDRDRAGFVIGEGAGVVILEELDHAKARGARIYAEIRGYGLSSDAHHMTAPKEDGEGAFLAMRQALKHAGIRPADVDYVNAHATSTRLGDAAENTAIKTLMLGEDGKRAASQINISSTKGAVGHLLGAAGAVEAIFTILAVHHNILPPTLNLEVPGDPPEAFDCNYVPKVAQDHIVNAALTNSFGFGGIAISPTPDEPRSSPSMVAPTMSCCVSACPCVLAFHPSYRREDVDPEARKIMDVQGTGLLMNGLKSKAIRCHESIPWLRKLPAPAVGIVLLLVLVQIVVWTVVGIVLHWHPSLVSTAAICYVLGLRHALDADHISAIDLMTRRLVASGQHPVTVGTFFSLGHSTIVIVTSAIVAASSTAIQHRFNGISTVGSIIGSSVSAAFLIILGAMNAYILYKLLAHLRSLICSPTPQSLSSSDLTTAFQGRSCASALIRTAFRLIDRPWKMYPLGVLFGLGFDTSSEVALLGISALQGARGSSLWLIMMFPVLFTAAMCLLDTLDGAAMMSLYASARLAADPIAVAYYQCVLTAITVVVALVVGVIQLLTLVLNVRPDLEDAGPFWHGVAIAGDHYDIIGGGICGTFVLLGALSVAFYQPWRRLVERRRACMLAAQVEDRVSPAEYGDVQRSEITQPGKAKHCLEATIAQVGESASDHDAR